MLIMQILCAVGVLMLGVIVFQLREINVSIIKVHHQLES
jgi:hypothetical protein